MRNKKQERGRRPGTWPVPVWLAALAALAALGLPAPAVDTDGDGIDDEYEIFFFTNYVTGGIGLDYANPADALQDNDADALVNLSEFQLNADPFAADTDRDGFPDGMDSNPVSRAYFNWGDPFWTEGDRYVTEYGEPLWLLGAFQTNGQWQAGPPPAWHVPADAEGEPYLAIRVDRQLLTNDVVMRMDLFDHASAALYVDLTDTNEAVIETNLFGNLLTGSNCPARIYADIPLEAHADAAGVHLRRGSGEVTVYTNLFYVDKDHDGLDADQELQLGTSDNNPDSDSDGLSDYQETLVYGTDPMNPDTDGDGLSDGAEALIYHTDPLRSDTDGDGLPDLWEVQHGFNPAGLAFAAVAGWWKLDETTGATAFDSSVNGNNGTISGAARVPGQVDNGLLFDGTANGQVAIANAAAYKPAHLTLAARANFTELFGNAVTGGAGDGRMVLAAQKSSGSGYGYALYKTERHSLVFELSNASLGTTCRVETADGFATCGQWYHAVGTYDGTNAALYVNGQLVASTPYAGGMDYDNGVGLLFGHGGLGADGYLAGALDDVLVLDEALSAQAVTDLDEASGDLDGDGLSNLEEYGAGTEPRNADDDADGLTDFEEVSIYGTNPNAADTDGDGLGDYQETKLYGTNPRSADTDADGLNDGWEIRYGRDPLALPAADLLGYWKLDETAGTVAVDSSGQGNDGTISGAASVAGIMAYARAFNGVNSEIAVAGAGARPSNTVSVAAYVTFTSLFGNATAGSAPDGHMVLLARKNTSDGLAYAFYKTERHSLVFEVGSAAGATQVETADGFAVTGGWYQLVGTYDGTNVALYVNGQPVGSVARSAPIECDPATGLLMGHGGLAADGYLAGALDDVRVYRAALNPQQVSALGEAGRDGDGDGLSNYQEALWGTDPDLADPDGDGMPDPWELANGFNPNDGSDGLLDPDHDLLLNVEEYQAGTDPHNADSDGDGLLDGYEVHVSHTDPLNADTDGDGLSDYWEVRYGLDPLAADDPDADPDGDGLSNAEEAALGSNPCSADSDADGLPDAWENANGFNVAAGQLTSLVSLWRFDEASGSVAYDDNLQWRNDGRLEDGAARTPLGHSGHALALDGQSGYALVPDDNGSLDSTRGLTLAMWVKVSAFDSTDSPVFFASKEDAAGHVEFALSYVESAHALQFSHANASNQTETVSVVSPLSTGLWTHLAVAVSNNQVAFYVNGVQQGAAQSLSYARSHVGDLLIGSTLATNAVAPVLDGAIDEVRFYNAALDAAQVAALLDAERDPDADGLDNMAEFRNGTSPAQDDATVDSDGDGLSNVAEITVHHTDPFLTDSDGDGVNDGTEIANGSNPLVADQGSSPNGPAVTIIRPEEGEKILW